MTFKTHDARKRELALRFGAALLAARRRKKIGKISIARQTGISRNALTYYERGEVLPRYASAVRIADALNSEHLTAVARECRTVPCAVCRKPFLNEGQFNTRYCGSSCHDVAQKKIANRQTHATAIRVERQLTIHRDAVAQMCNECEPRGACRMPDCPLRLVSPLPLIVHETTEAMAPPGRWGGGSRLDGAPLSKRRTA